MKGGGDGGWERRELHVVHYYLGSSALGIFVNVAFCALKIMKVTKEGGSNGDATYWAVDFHRTLLMSPVIIFEHCSLMVMMLCLSSQFYLRIKRFKPMDMTNPTTMDS